MSHEAFLGSMPYLRGKHVKQKWREHASLPETFANVERIREIPVNQPHACLHAAVEFADVGELSRGHTRTSNEIPQKGSVDRVICFGKVDEAQVQGGVVLLRLQFLMSS